MSYTKGPWSTHGPSIPSRDTPEGGDFAVLADGALIAEAFHRSSPTATHPAEANARLIAAAPELLEALERVTDCLNDPGVGDLEQWKRDVKTWTNKARAAIKKARGPQ